MRFPKATREMLYGSEGKPVSIQWPQEAAEPQPGHRYTIQSSHRAGESAIRVLKVDGDDGNWTVTCQLDSDESHLLGRSGGYVGSHSRSIRAKRILDDGGLEIEPEAIPPADIEALSKQKRTQRSTRLRERIQKAEEALNELQADDDFAPNAADIQFHRNMIRKLERKLERAAEDERMAA